LTRTGGAAENGFDPEDGQAQMRSIPGRHSFAVRRRWLRRWLHRWAGAWLVVVGLLLVAVVVVAHRLIMGK
jgi:hypothetical protein